MKRLKNRIDDDGGYYAIKGFAFQFNKAILEILNQTDENTPVRIEHIQDISSDDCVLQVKYKEEQEYSANKIKEPVLQLMEEFEKDRTKNYVLYCYFCDKVYGEKTLTLEELNSIITPSTGVSKKAKRINEVISSITTELKSSFIGKFKLIFAPDYNSQFKDVLEKLTCLNFIGNDKELAIFLYSNIIDYLKRIIINNQTPVNRKCTKREILEYLKSNKKRVFDSSYAYYKGERAYFKYVKDLFVLPRKNQKNLIILGEINIDAIVTTSKLIIDITESYFKKAKYNIEPLTFVIEDNLEIKKELIAQKFFFNDGYETIQFNEELFNEHAIKLRKNIGNKASESLGNISFKLRILSKSNFIQIKNQPNYQMIYYFDHEIIHELNSKSYIKIDNLTTKQILDLFKF